MADQNNKADSIHRIHPGALEASITELSAWLEADGAEPLTSGQGESVGLIVKACERFLAHHAAPAVPAVDALTRYDAFGDPHPRGPYVMFDDVQAGAEAPILYARQIDIDDTTPDRDVIASGVAVDGWTVPLYLASQLRAAPADPEQAKLDSLAQAGLAAALERWAKGEQSKGAGAVAVEQAALTEFIDQYEWRTDEFCHAPTENEREMLRDFAVMLHEEFASQPQATPLEATSDDEPTTREQLIACLGDDAAKLADANPDDEMAQTMREAAAMLEADEQMGGAQVASIEHDQQFNTLLERMIADAGVPDHGKRCREAYEELVEYLNVRTLTEIAAAPADLRPTDDALWDQTIRDRDTYHEWADKLAEAIAKHVGVDIGEHSNMNCPWAEALEVIENAEPITTPRAAEGAATSERKPLTDGEIFEHYRALNLPHVPVMWTAALGTVRAIEQHHGIGSAK